MNTIQFSGPPPSAKKPAIVKAEQGASCPMPCITSIATSGTTKPPAAETSSSELDAMELKITELWSAKAKTRAAVAKTRKQLQENRRELGRNLAAYKEALAKTGRDGKWSKLLKQAGISKATADRYVQEFIGRRKLLTEEISDVEVQNLAMRYARLLHRKHLSAEQKASFMRILADELQRVPNPKLVAEEITPAPPATPDLEASASPEAPVTLTDADRSNKEEQGGKATSKPDQRDPDRAHTARPEATEQRPSSS
ncbi:hypothetical protein [Terriglobus aquaticus]|uniref:Uncharacterized protein n=1 Tax=Terriglobus aquaticus TaxID=940139 RepID=A0ABW9KI13_9BACT|nr:hypothetical protein [Terriglobus aquaticus]